MDCERCESLLIDYVAGELGEAEVAEVRAALEVCEHCRLALAKIERGHALAQELPELEPPPAIFAAVMRAAEERAAALAREEAASHPPEHAPAPKRVALDESSPLDGVWRWLAGLLHGPQFAMAALLLLSVGVGLWWVPALSGPRAVPPPLVSDTPAATGPTASLEPREVPHMEIDPRTGRVVAPPEPGSGAAEERGEAGTRVAVAEVAEAPHEVREAAGEARDREVGPALVDRGVEGEADREALAAVAALELGAGTSLSGHTETGALPPLAPPSVAPAMGATPTPTPSAPGSGAYAGAERVARSSLDDDADSVPAPSPDDSMLPASLHTQARLLARSGSLAEAARTYERLLAEHDDYASAPRAMVELAEVYRRSGSLGASRRWLERAARFPTAATDARRELARLDAMDRATTLDLEASDSAEAAAAEPGHATTSAPSGE